MESEATTILVDAGPDLRYQLLRSGTKDIDAVFITHEHQDHTAGLDELRAINFVQGHPIPIYCTEQVERRLREQYSYIFSNPDYPGIPQIYFVRMPEGAFQVGDIAVESIKLLHGDLPVRGFKFGDFAYCTDANALGAGAEEQLRGIGCLVLNALRKEKHHSHYTLEEALELADALGVGELWMTHVSHQMGRYGELEKGLPEGRRLAWDGMVIE